MFLAPWIMDAVWQEVRIAFNIQNDVLSELFVQLNVSFSSLVLDYITLTVMAYVSICT